MPRCLFVSDLHGKIDRYSKLFSAISNEKPDAVFIGGDILPSITVDSGGSKIPVDMFITDYLGNEFSRLKNDLGELYPEMFIIFGNDDPAIFEEKLLTLESMDLCRYANGRNYSLGKFDIYGYSFIPPSPFQLKDWDRYDVSRYVDPGCISPESGAYSIQRSADEKKWSTIEKDMENLTKGKNLEYSIFLFHSPPYGTNLDMAGIEGKIIDHVPADPHVGSIAIKRFIEDRQPLLTLHGHIHESTSITGQWMEKIGRTVCLTGAHDGPQLAIIRFDTESPESAERELI